ncbi:MAG: ATP-binding cassette domain-containing protein, partial [Devosia sp.]
ILDGMRALNVKASSPQASVAHLSGGNQQKLLFARVLMRAPRVLLLDEPTKGVDAGTRHEIYRLIVDLAEKGVGLLVVASELEEVIGLCDRCLVIADGQIVDEFSRGEGSEERVLRSVAAAQAANQRAALAAVLP